MAKRPTAHVKLPAFMLMLAIGALSACSLPGLGGYGATGQSKEAFKLYVEKVFRLQNGITSDLMAMQEDGGDGNHDALLAAERQMHESCAALNEYAARDSDGLDISLWLRARVEHSAAACEQSALKVQALMAQP